MKNKLQIRIYDHMREIADRALADVVRNYHWGMDDVFVHIRPVSVINLPPHYYVGEGKEGVPENPITDLQEGFLYYDRASANVYTANALDNLALRATKLPRIVIDLENTNFPLGVLTNPEEDWYEVLDVNQVTPEILSEAVQDAFNAAKAVSALKQVKVPKPESFDYRSVLDSLPDPDED